MKLKIPFEVCVLHNGTDFEGCPHCEVEELEQELAEVDDPDFDDDDCDDLEDVAAAAEQVWAALREGKPFDPDVWPFDELRTSLRLVDRKAP